MSDIFDTPRHAPHVKALQGNTYTVAEFGNLPLRIDDTGISVAAPLRMTWSDQLGIALELGPYSISTEDAAQLRAVLNDYLARAAWCTGLPEPY